MKWRTTNCILWNFHSLWGRLKTGEVSVEEVLQRNVNNMINEQFKLFVSAMICLLNLKLVNVESTKTSLRRIFRKIVQLNEEKVKQRALFLLFSWRWCLESVLSLLCHELTGRNVFFLRAVDIYLTALHRSFRKCSRSTWWTNCTKIFGTTLALLTAKLPFWLCIFCRPSLCLYAINSHLLNAENAKNVAMWPVMCTTPTHWPKQNSI